MGKGLDLLRKVLQDRLEEKRREKLMSTTKYCPKCRKDLPADLDHFYKDSRSKTGLSSWCKKCQTVSVSSRSAAGKKLVLTLDFSEYEILFEDIKAEAATMFRTPEMQAMWLVSEALHKKGAGHEH